MSEYRNVLVDLFRQSCTRRMPNGSTTHLTPDDAECLVAALDRYLDEREAALTGTKEGKTA